MTPDGCEHVTVAHWLGCIAPVPEGNDGFPYDSILIPAFHALAQATSP